MDIQQFEARKRDHIRHALDPRSQAAGLSGLDRVHLWHDALPELDLEEVRIESLCLGRPAKTPFYVAGMTAGHPDAFELNRRLALACQRRGWAMGVGSQRRELADSSAAREWPRLREEASGLTLFANLGLSQLIGAPVERVQELVDSIGAEALVVHVNALQEALQPEGTPRFKGGLAALKKLCAGLDAPVVLKETGCGFSAPTLERLNGVGLAAIDLSGLGGTHWGRIEGARAPEGSLLNAAAETFRDWGESTVDSLLAARKTLSGVELWASGGVRSGLDAAKLLALGAERVGYAKPALEAALAGQEALENWMALQEYELRVALFCTGCVSPSVLRRKERAGVWSTELNSDGNSKWNSEWNK